MLSALEARGRAIGAEAQARAMASTAARLREALPDVAVTIEESAVLLSGRGLLRRLAEDARVRWIGGMLR